MKKGKTPKYSQQYYKRFMAIRKALAGGIISGSEMSAAIGKCGRLDKRDGLSAIVKQVNAQNRRGAE
ncbi:MAG: hypothetical protein IKO55_09610 [Kiritimatiellae bacterium]|nr:hypothetical protein [Kiritimatiellia bacterium]